MPKWHVVKYTFTDKKTHKARIESPYRAHSVSLITNVSHPSQPRLPQLFKVLSLLGFCSSQDTSPFCSRSPATSHHLVMAPPGQAFPTLSLVVMMAEE